MLRAYAFNFYQLGTALHILEIEARGLPRASKIELSEGSNLGIAIRETRQRCDTLGLQSALAAISRLLSQEPVFLPAETVANEVREIHRRAVDELQDRHFLYLNPDRADLYEDECPLGKEIEDTFPKIRPDVSEAAKCLALDRHTAAVFHLTRVLEFGLDRFVDRLKATPATATATWGTKLGAAKAKILLPARATKAQLNKYRKASAVYDAFESTKDAWRNPVAHDLGLMYTPDKAQVLFDRTHQVFQTLLEFLKTR